MKDIIAHVFLSIAVFLMTQVGMASGQTDDDKQMHRFYLRARQQMVARQIRDRGITDPTLLDAFMKVKRHLFVPERYAPYAYEDHPLPIGEGQTISQPYIVAYMTSVLGLSRDYKVLEIGTGSGYQAAILGELCDRVYTIEIVPSLGRKAKSLLEKLGYRHVAVKIGDGYKGWPAHAPYDAIIVTCSPTHVPEPLKKQLREGGRMVIPVGPPHHQKLVLLRKRGQLLEPEKTLPVRFVPMVGPTGKPY